MTREEVTEIAKQQFDYLNAELQIAEKFQPEKTYFMKQWSGYVQAPNELLTWDTGVNFELLSFIGKSSVYYPPDFVRNCESLAHDAFTDNFVFFFLEHSSTRQKDIR
jgi:hypothetical protein